MKRILNVLVTVAFGATFVCNNILGSEASGESKDKPDEADVVMVEVLGAVVGGAVGGYATWMVAPKLLYELTGHPGNDYESLSFGIYLLGSIAATYGLGPPLGSALGTGLVGWSANQRGSFWWSWAGAELGGIAGLGLAFVLPLGAVENPAAAIPAIAIGSGAGAVVGYNLSRWLEGSPSTASLDESLGSSGPEVSLLVPEVELRRDRISKTVEPTYKLTVAKLNF